MKTWKSTVIVLGFAALSASASEFPNEWTWDSKAESRAVHATLEGKAMPPLGELTEWINGEVKPADMKGKVVLVDFYATWCGPCMNAIPHNNELLKQYKDKGLVIVGVCTSGRGQEKFAANAKEHGIQYSAACDATLASAKTWQAHYYPTYAVVDRKGVVRVVGLQPGHVEAVVQKLLAEPAP